MSKIAFFMVQAGDKDISLLINDFHYEDSAREDDLLRLTLPALTKEEMDANFLISGTLLKFQFGYYGGEISPLRQSPITDVKKKYAQTMSIVITALDLGQIMKKDQKQRVWLNKTASEIATEIGQSYGLDTSYIEATTKRYPHLPQGNRTDWEMLKYLAKIEQNGSFYVYVKDNALLFARFSFEPSWRDSQQKSDTQTLTRYNPATKKNETVTVNTDNAKDQTLLGNTVSQTANKTTPTEKMKR
jgi:phage protein D